MYDKPVTELRSERLEALGKYLKLSDELGLNPIDDMAKRITDFSTDEIYFEPQEEFEYINLK